MFCCCAEIASVKYAFVFIQQSSVTSDKSDGKNPVAIDPIDKKEGL